MSTTTFKFEDTYHQVDIQASVTNGSERVSLGLRAMNDFRGVGGSMTPDVARALAADLIARADDIDRRKS